MIDWVVIPDRQKNENSRKRMCSLLGIIFPLEKNISGASHVSIRSWQS
jgi:hypothetical protein